ncbi:hypothetical protein [Emticicia oligotrophica]|uniref:hypothetical protein n=1 Tax=Emticicia oligotrophica TaxID=312279 RepID=UPI00273CDC69|nr:hypothetical protein [Emticicia oligotrophica]
MKKLYFFTFVLLSQFSFAQKIVTSPSYPITKINLDYPPQISGYEINGNVLKVYALSTVKGSIPMGAKILDNLLKSSSNSDGSPLLIENEIDLRKMSLQKNTANTLISQFTAEGFVVNKKSKIKQEFIEKVLLSKDINNSNILPSGEIKTKYIDGSFEMDYNTGIPTFVSTPKKVEQNSKFGSITPVIRKINDYDLPNVKGIKDKENKISTKLYFEVSIPQNGNNNRLEFKTAKDFQNAVLVTDITNKKKGFLLVFKNDEVKETQYLDPNPNNITLCFYDSEGIKKYIAEIESDIVSKWIKVEKAFEKNGELYVIVNFITSLTKSETQLFKISIDGKSSKILIPNDEDINKIINIQTKNREIMGPISIEYLNTLTSEYSYAQIFEASKNEVNKGEKPIGEVIYIFNHEFVPIKQYYNKSLSSSEYTYLEKGNSIIKSVGEDDFIIQLIKDDIIIKQLNPVGFKRPEMIIKYNTIAQTNDNIYFIYVNKDYEFVVVAIEK